MASISIPITDPMISARKYMSGLPIVGSTKIPPWGAIRVQPNSAESAPAAAEPMIQLGMT